MTFTGSRAQVQIAKPKAPVSSPTPQTDFADEAKEQAKYEEQAQEEVRQMQKEARRPTNQIVVSGAPPGKTGLKWFGTTQRKMETPSSFSVFTYSELKSLRQAGKLPFVYTIVSVDSAKKELLVFANYSVNDGGHLTDPLLLNNNHTVVMKNGGYGYLQDYTLYVFDKPTKRVFRLTSGLVNPQYTVSPNRRYMTYISGGDEAGPGSFHGGEEPVDLHAWDSQLNHDIKVATNLRLQGSYSWKSDHELIYSQEEKRGAILVPNSYIWDATTGKSRLWLKDCQAPVLSPNGLYVVYAAPLDATKDFSPANSTYVVQNLKSGKKTAVECAGLGKYDPNRQVTWSADSRLAFSMLHLWTDTVVVGHRLFVYDRASRKPLSYALLKPQETATLLASSSKGKRVFLLRQRILSPKLNAVGDWDYGFSVDSVDTQTGKATTIWEKPHILGLSDASIVFNKEFLKD